MAASVPTPRRGPRSRPRGEGLASTPRGGHRGLPPSENIAPALGTKFIVQAHPDQNVLCHKRSCPSPSSLSSPARAGRGRLQPSALSARRESHTRTWSQPTAPADTADSAMRGRKERSQRARRAGCTGRCWKGLQRRVSCPRPCGRVLPLSQRRPGRGPCGLQKPQATRLLLRLHLPAHCKPRGPQAWAMSLLQATAKPEDRSPSCQLSGRVAAGARPPPQSCGRRKDPAPRQGLGPGNFRWGRAWEQEKSNIGLQRFLEAVGSSQRCWRTGQWHMGPSRALVGARPVLRLRAGRLLVLSLWKENGPGGCHLHS